jgi:hypothetical protein
MTEGMSGDESLGQCGASHLTSMRLAHKATALLLLAALGSFAAGQAFPPVEFLHKPPAGCHEHSQKAPSSAPMTYQCCATGHNAAVLQPVLDLDTLLPVSPVPDLTSPVSTGFILGSFSQHFSANRPPGSATLRI